MFSNVTSVQECPYFLRINSANEDDRSTAAGFKKKIIQKQFSSP